MKSVFSYRHVIWDWNGTLFDDLHLCVDVINGVLTSRDMKSVTVEEYQDVFDFPVIDYYRRLGFDFNKESFETVGTEWVRTYESRRLEAGLRRDAKTVVTAIHDAGLGQSVLSAYLQQTLDQLVAHFGLAGNFTKLLGLQNHYAESKLENGLQWIQELGCDSRDVLFIGDTIHDFEVADAMQVDCLLLGGGHQSEEKLRACAVPVLSELAELPGMHEVLNARSG